MRSMRSDSYRGPRSTFPSGMFFEVARKDSARSGHRFGAVSRRLRTSPRTDSHSKRSGSYRPTCSRIGSRSPLQTMSRSKWRISMTKTANTSSARMHPPSGTPWVASMAVAFASHSAPRVSTDVLRAIRAIRNVLREMAFFDIRPAASPMALCGFWARSPRSSPRPEDALDTGFSEIRKHCDPKEQWAEPLLAKLGTSGPGGGRERAMRALKGQWRGLRDTCVELRDLRNEIQSGLARS